MPTASTDSTEKRGLNEAQTPIKQAIAIVEKKVRNLEKRKNKLDLIKQKAASGGKLEADQRIAIERYDEVIQTLEYSRELQKQFTAISNEAGKLMKKQARREKLDRQHHEMKRIQEMLKVQNLLDSLGTEEIRADFQTGKHGAVVLTEENLNHLDELYQLISPTREGEGDYHVKLNSAADHIVSLLEGKNKEVIGTTYKDLKELIDLIGGCGYFEVVQKLETEAKSTAESVEAVTEEQVEGSIDAASSEDGKSESQADETPLELSSGQMPQETLEQVVPPQLNNMAAASDSAYYANEVYPQAPVQRPIDEIVSSVQGSFNFLQESTIDVDSVAHTDPAVVAAQPMTRQSSQPTPDSESRPISGFTNQTYERQTDPANTQTSQLSSNSRGEQQQRYPAATDQTARTQQNMDYPSSQPFRQNALSQNLQNESPLFPSTGEDSSQISMMNQAGPDNSLGQFDIPPSIPLPQSQENQQSNISNQSEKKFQMNAAAPVFQSQLYSQQGSQEQGGDGSNHFGQNSDNSGGNYQNNRYQNDGFQQRGPRRDGGFRNSRGRGGNGGGGGNSSMQNGYNRNSGGGGGGQNSGRGRGGSYQGYPPRNNYQPDGYQGYNNSGGFNQGYKQRSGSANNQGQMRGSSGTGGGMRGNMRGGAPRGGGNNSQRGGGGPRGSGGNYGRPTSAQYQQ